MERARQPATSAAGSQPIYGDQRPSRITSCSPESEPAPMQGFLVCVSALQIYIQFTLSICGVTELCLDLFRARYSVHFLYMFKRQSLKGKD